MYYLFKFIQASLFHGDIKTQVKVYMLLTGIIHTKLRTTQVGDILGPNTLFEVDFLKIIIQKISSNELSISNVIINTTEALEKNLKLYITDIVMYLLLLANNELPIFFIFLYFLLIIIFILNKFIL